MKTTAPETTPVSYPNRNPPMLAQSVSTARGNDTPAHIGAAGGDWRARVDTAAAWAQTKRAKAGARRDAGY